MTPFDLIIWALAAAVAIVIIGFAIAIAVISVVTAKVGASKGKVNA